MRVTTKQDNQYSEQPPQQQPTLLHKGTCSRMMQKLPLAVSPSMRVTLSCFVQLSSGL